MCWGEQRFRRLTMGWMSGRIGASGRPPLLINLKGEGQRRDGGWFKSAHESSKWNAWSVFSTVRTRGNEACFDEECQKMLFSFLFRHWFYSLLHIFVLYLTYTFVSNVFTPCSHSRLNSLLFSNKKKKSIQYSWCCSKKLMWFWCICRQLLSHCKLIIT